MATIQITLEVLGNPAAALAAVDDVLDCGTLQDEINERDGVRVTSAVVEIGATASDVLAWFAKRFGPGTPMHGDCHVREALAAAVREFGR